MSIEIVQYVIYILAMMNATELDEQLTALGVLPSEVAQLLGVSPRTVRRWLEGEEVPGPAEAALRAWRTLADRRLPWKPDSVSIFEDDQDQIARHRRHTEELAALLKRVEARGGARNPWTVDLEKCTATFGHFEVGFYKLQSGGFSLSTYRRKDKGPDLASDMPDIEDAAFCIARAFAKAQSGPAALKAVADYTRKHSSIFVVDGPKLLDRSEKARRQKTIEAVADKIDELAVVASEGRAKYQDFESLLGELHAVGFFPLMSLISDVAHSLV
jgi:transcriptional regulator with XRE-family HTH domain